jgi:hypothetical protein
MSFFIKDFFSICNKHSNLLAKIGKRIKKFIGSAAVCEIIIELKREKDFKREDRKSLRTTKK